MKLIKLNTETFIVVDGKPTLGDVVYCCGEVVETPTEICPLCKKVTHSTQHELHKNGTSDKVKSLCLDEVIELILSPEVWKEYTEMNNKNLLISPTMRLGYSMGYLRGYYQALENHQNDLQLPTQWDVEIENDYLILK